MNEDGSERCRAHLVDIDHDVGSRPCAVDSRQAPGDRHAHAINGSLTRIAATLSIEDAAYAEIRDTRMANARARRHFACVTALYDDGFAGMCKAAGFRLTPIVPTAARVSVIEGAVA
jgi:hypothetical protein